MLRAIITGVIAVQAVLLICCGSAVEPVSLSPGTNAAAAGSGNDSQPLMLGAYEGLVDPQGAATFQVFPLNAGLQALSTLFVASADYLADVTPNVSFSINWRSFTYDYGSNRISMFSPPCLINNDSTWSYFGVKVNFTQFTNSNVIMGEGAISDGSGYHVDFQDMDVNGTFLSSNCRSFSLSNTSASTYRFVATITAASQSNTPPVAGIAVSDANFSYTGTNAVAVVGDGFNSTFFSGSGYLFVNGVDMNQSGFCSLLGIGGNSFDSISCFFMNGVVTPGFLTVNTQSNGTLQGPYVIQPQQVWANLQLPSGGPITSTVFYFRCGTGPQQCTIDVGTGCPTGYSDLEATRLVSLYSTQLTSTEMSRIEQTGNSQIFIGFDVNQNDILDAGDYLEGPISVTLSAGKRHSLGNVTLSNLLTGTCL